MRCWVCARCETGGRDVPPLRCWSCGQPAIDAGHGSQTIDVEFVESRLVAPADVSSSAP